jgi:hypothetical protein
MVSELDHALREFDAGTLHPADAAAILASAIDLERRAVAVKTLVAARAAQSNAWSTGGYRSPEDWLSQASGTNAHDARNILETSEKLEDLPDTAEALRNGELSQDQIAEIARRPRPRTRAGC